MLHSESPVRLKDPEMELYNSWQTFRVLGSLQGMDISRNSNIDTYVLYVRLRLLYVCTDAMYVCTDAMYVCTDAIYVCTDAIYLCIYNYCRDYAVCIHHCMYICKYVPFIYTHARMHRRTHAHTHTCARARTHTHTRTHTYAQACIHMYYMHTNIVPVVYQVQLQLYVYDMCILCMIALVLCSDLFLQYM